MKRQTGFKVMENIKNVLQTLTENDIWTIRYKAELETRLNLLLSGEYVDMIGFETFKKLYEKILDLQSGKCKINPQYDYDILNIKLKAYKPCGKRTAAAINKPLINKPMSISHAETVVINEPVTQAPITPAIETPVVHVPVMAMPSGRLKLSLDYNQWKALAADKKTWVKKYFLWSYNSCAWVSKAVTPQALESLRKNIVRVLGNKEALK